MENKFFISRLNTILLFILIVLMVVAIKIMLENKEANLNPFVDQKQEQTKNKVPEILGNKDDLVLFSVFAGQKVNGILKITGSVKGGYFFEGNIGVNVLDINKNIIKTGTGIATTDWMTSAPVSFETTIDFTKLPKGSAYIQIKNDNPSDIRKNDKSIIIPVIID